MDGVRLQARSDASGRSVPEAIFAKALLMVWFMSLDAICSRRAALDTVWQSLYLLSMVSLARKMTSERMMSSGFVTACQNAIFL